MDGIQPNIEKDQARNFLGNVLKGISGKLLFQTDPEVEAVQFALAILC